MDKKKEISAVEQERIELVQKLTAWVNENPKERACVCILSSGDTTSTTVVGNRRLCVEATTAAINTEESAVKELVMESLMLSAISKVSKVAKE